jgi:hypothetical protein
MLIAYSIFNDIFQVISLYILNINFQVTFNYIFLENIFDVFYKSLEMTHRF